MTTDEVGEAANRDDGWLPDFTNVVIKSAWHPNPTENFVEYRRLLESFSPETLNLIRNHFVSGETSMRYYAVDVVHQLRTLFGCNSPYIENNVIALLRIVPKDMKTDSHLNYYIPILMSFFDDEELAKDKIHEYDDALLESLAARLRLTYQLARFLSEENERLGYEIPLHLQPLHDCITYSKEYMGAAILNDSLRKLAEAHSGRIHELVDIVLEHRTEDPEVVEELLAHHASLGRGAL